jgi:hypothetical protein
LVEQAAKQIGIERFGAHDFATPGLSYMPQERRRPGVDQVLASQAILFCSSKRLPEPIHSPLN